MVERFGYGDVGAPRVASTSRRLLAGCGRLLPQSQQGRDADMPHGGTSAPPHETGNPPDSVGEELPPPSEKRICPRPAEGEGPGDEGVAASPEPPQGSPLPSVENTQNRGNEAKKSLKTNAWAKIECAQRAPCCARKAPNEANKVAFRCAPRHCGESNAHRSHSAIGNRPSAIVHKLTFRLLDAAGGIP